MKIHTYKELIESKSLLRVVKDADAAKRPMASGPHWVEAVVARYLTRKRRGICFFIYVRSLSDGEHYRIAITMAHCTRDFDRLVRQHPVGSVYRMEMVINKGGNPTLSDLRYLYTPTSSSAMDRIPAALLLDWCQELSSKWHRVPLIRKFFSKTGYELVILCKRPKLMVDAVDLANRTFGIGSRHEMVQALLDWDRYFKVVEQLPPDRAFTESLTRIHSVLAMVPPLMAPSADETILSGEVIGYSSERTKFSDFNVTYAFIDSEPLRGGEKSSRKHVKADEVISQRILLALMTVLKPRIIITSGHDVARQVPKIFEPLLLQENPVPQPPFRRARKNRLWGLHVAVGKIMSMDLVIPQRFKTYNKEAFFIPILDVGYWGRSNIYKSNVVGGYWASIVRFFQGYYHQPRRPQDPEKYPETL